MGGSPPEVIRAVLRREIRRDGSDRGKIWRIANGLCGTVDGCDFKVYVLGMLFYRFISENSTAYLNERERLVKLLDAEIVRIVARQQELQSN